MSWRFLGVLGLVLVAAPPASAAAGATLKGVVTDTATDAPIVGATVTVASTNGQRTDVTDEDGRYAFTELPAGEVSVLVTFGAVHLEHAHVVVRSGETVGLADRLDASGETITVREKAPPSVPAQPPRPTHATAIHPLPYSDEAFETNVWGVVWLLLDVDATGRVVALKLYKRAGHGLDEIAVREAWKLRFEPARDGQGAPAASKVMWKMEWEPMSLKFMQLENGHTTNERQPCAGTGPMNLDYLSPVYRDCSPPDYKLGAREPWLRSPDTAAAPAPLSVEDADCDAGDHKSCYNLALAIQKRDARRAALLYLRACEGGMAIACSNLGLMVQAGEGIAKDAARASILYQRACAAGEPIGCTNLGQLYMNGADVPRDPVRARPALEKACAKNEAVGCFNLSILVDWGVGEAKPDPTRAAELRAKACRGGFTKACTSPRSE